jgi:ribosomal protein L14
MKICALVNDIDLVNVKKEMLQNEFLTAYIIAEIVVRHNSKTLARDGGTSLCF